MIFKKPEKKTARVQITVRPTKKELAMAAIKVVRDNVPKSPEVQDALTWAMKVLEDAEMERDCSEKPNGSDLISRQDAVSEIDEWIQMATGNETDMAIKDFLSFLKKRIESLPSAEPKTDDENRNARIIYNFLKKKIGSEIIDNPFEFEGWYNRMIWHVQKCYRLQKEYEGGEMAEPMR